MIFLRRLTARGVICLMTAWGAQPLVAAEPMAVSRAVEVAPPQGWTPDTPLFGPDALVHQDVPRARTSGSAASVVSREPVARSSVKGRVAAQKADRPGARVTRGQAPKLRSRASLAERRLAPRVARQAAGAVAGKPPRNRQPVTLRAKARTKIRTKAQAKPVATQRSQQPAKKAQQGQVRSRAKPAGRPGAKKG